MAFDYTSAGPFGDIGKLVKYFNTFATSAQGIDTIVDAILDQFEAGNQQAALNGLRPEAEENWQAEYENRRATLRDYAAARLQDYATVLTQIGATTDNLDEILARLIEQMTTDSESVERTVPTVGSVTAGGANIGDGTIFVTSVLDGVTSPGSRSGVQFPAHHLYHNTTSELAVAETLKFRCISDSFSGGLTEGAEQFSWEGGPADTQYGTRSAEGSGQIGTFTAIHGETAEYLQNADFEDAAVANTPDNWTIDMGVAGTTIKLDTTGANVYHGDQSFQFYGNGATANLQISQAVTLSPSMHGRGFLLSFRYKGDSTSCGLRVKLNGTVGVAWSYTSAISSAFFPSAWTLQTVAFIFPNDIPSDLRLEIRADGTLANTKSIWVDDIGYAPLNYGAGLAAVAIRGATAFVVNDRFTCPITVVEGVIQKFFRRAFGVMLPSDASPTIDDAWAS